MKGAFLLSEDREVFAQVASVLRARGASYAESDGGVVQLRDDAGHLLTVFGDVPAGTDWEFRSPPDAVMPGVVCPDLERVTACSVECRDEEWFVAVMADLAAALEGPAWVLDGDGKLWAAAELDAARLTL